MTDKIEDPGPETPQASAWTRARPVLQAIGLGTVGGLIFAALNAPLAFMLGAMLFVLTASFAGVKLEVPTGLRATMIAVLGVMLGSAFTPDLVGRLSALAPALIVLSLIIIVSAAFGFFYFHKICGYDRVTSYFAAAPGGLSEMAIVGESHGGDIRTISIMHVIRIMIVVSTVPFFFRFVMDLDVPVVPADSIYLVELPWREALILTVCAVVGAPLAMVLRLPAAPFFGPLALSVLVHALGWSSAPPPIELIAFAQIVLGTAIGSRFVGYSARAIAAMVPQAAFSAVVMIAIAVAGAWLTAPLLGVDATTVFLALAPGGVAEMSIIALSLGGDAIFVSTLHMIRIVMIITFVPLVWSIGNKQARA